MKATAQSKDDHSEEKSSEQYCSKENSSKEDTSTMRQISENVWSEDCNTHLLWQHLCFGWQQSTELYRCQVFRVPVWIEHCAHKLSCSAAQVCISKFGS